MFYKYIEV